MKKIFMLILILVFVASCAPSPEAIQKAIEETQTSMPTNTSTPNPTPTPTTAPTPTPTPIPLSEFNLEGILLLEGDLPAGYNVKPSSNVDAGTIFEDFVGRENFLIQRFNKEGDGVGTVAILLFQDIDERNSAYESIISNELETWEYTSKSEISDIGEMGYLYYTQIFPQPKDTINFLTFVRCNALVYMVKTLEGKETIILREYAKKLDARLIESFCP